MIHDYAIDAKFIQVLYYKSNKWRVYEDAEYSIKDFKDVEDAEDLIKEVMMEKHVARRNIKLVKPIYIVYESVSLNDY